MFLPIFQFPAGEVYIKESNTIEKIADKYGVDYINFLGMNIVDYDKDCADPGAHLTVSGAKKITSFLGEYLQKKYPDIVLNHKDDIKYSAWNSDYQEYVNEKNHLIQEEVDLNKYLMFLCDRDYNVSLQITDRSILEDSIYGKWCDDMNVDVSMASGGDVCIKVTFSKTGELIDSVIISNEKKTDWEIIRE